MPLTNKGKTNKLFLRIYTLQHEIEGKGMYKSIKKIEEVKRKLISAKLNKHQYQTINTIINILFQYEHDKNHDDLSYMQLQSIIDVIAGKKIIDDEIINNQNQMENDIIEDETKINQLEKQIQDIDQEMEEVVLTNKGRWQMLCRQKRALTISLNNVKRNYNMRIKTSENKALAKAIEESKSFADEIERENGQIDIETLKDDIDFTNSVIENCNQINSELDNMVIDNFDGLCGDEAYQKARQEALLNAKQNNQSDKTTTDETTEGC